MGSPIPIAWALMVGSLFLPALNLGDTAESGIGAISLAYEQGGFYGMISSLSNLAFIATAVLFYRRPRGYIKFLLVAISLAFALNSWWLIGSGGDDLMIGYYAWLASFAVMAMGLFVLLRATPKLDTSTADATDGQGE
ncbi:MAG: hypothetical protein KDD44_10440 [Bdellovibrionales bacterium]|nr:hypothetical protein [Bdellovibrionales bacterium]